MAVTTVTQSKNGEVTRWGLRPKEGDWQKRKKKLRLLFLAQRTA